MKLHALVFLFMAPLLAAADQGPTGSAANGKILFTKIGCFECHGYAGQGGGAGARIAPTPLRAQDLIRYVRRPPGAMPAYTEKVASDQELTDIYAYLKSLPPPKPVKDIPLLEKMKTRQ
ncbi:MAG TPA: cytochrome c [Bryobacteraceae bacterium]|nr:cytochrome c [Bryobacteraceae bacterium]